MRFFISIFQQTAPTSPIRDVKGRKKIDDFSLRHSQTFIMTPRYLGNRGVATPWFPKYWGVATPQFPKHWGVIFKVQ